MVLPVGVIVALPNQQESHLECSYLDAVEASGLVQTHPVLKTT
jgi:hypothetical protein